MKQINIFEVNDKVAFTLFGIPKIGVVIEDSMNDTYSVNVKTSSTSSYWVCHTALHLLDQKETQMQQNYEQSEQYLLHKHSTKLQFLNLARNIYQALPYTETVRRINVHTYINTLEAQITELEATLWPNLNDLNSKSVI